MNPLVVAFKEGFEVAVNKHFIDVATSVRPGALGGNSVFLHFTLGKDKTEWQNGVSNNDPVNFLAYITQLDEDKYVVEFSRASIGGLKPTEKFYAQSSIKIRTRKTTGNAQKILSTVDKVLGKFADTVLEQDLADNFLDLPIKPGHKVDAYWEDF
jgi:hypothetical protein